jgi:NTP pyrophosphatase (non-canonical NTP hydrolase)
MKLSQYQIEANRTCPDLGSEAINLAHMVLGICSEQEEALKALVEKDNVGIGEEIADTYWYIANYCSFRGYDLEDLHNNRFNVTIENWEEEVDLNSVYLSRLQDLVKKYLAYGKSINREIEENTLKGLLLILQNSNNEYNLNLHLILQNNIDKLRVRFPDKFDTEKAINRNLDEERKELEK